MDPNTVNLRERALRERLQKVRGPLSSNGTNERQWATRRYAHVMPGHEIFFRNRAEDKTVDSHDVFDGQRVTFLAQDGSIPEKPFYTGEAGDRGHLEIALTTALSGLANRLQPDEVEVQAQSIEHRQRRLVVAESMFQAAMWSLVTRRIGPSEFIAEDLGRFLYSSGQRERVSDDLLATTAHNMEDVTRRNIEDAIRKARS